MYSPFVRSLFIVSSLGLSGYFFIVGNSTSGLLFLACAVLFGWTLFRHGSAYRAFQLYRQGDSTRARHFLRLADKSKWDTTSMAYHELLEGAFHMEEGHLAQAEIHLCAVNPDQLRSDDHRGLLKVHLAELAYRKGELERAKVLLADAAEFAEDPRTHQRIDSLSGRMNS